MGHHITKVLDARGNSNLFFNLLQDAQSKFRNMVEDNKQLAARIDNSIHLANEEVNVLRGELRDTNKRLSQISEATNDRTKNGPNNNNMEVPVQVQHLQSQKVQGQATHLQGQSGKLQEGQVSKECQVPCVQPDNDCK